VCGVGLRLRLAGVVRGLSGGSVGTGFSLVTGRDESCSSVVDQWNCKRAREGGGVGDAAGVMGDRGSRWW